MAEKTTIILEALMNVTQVESSIGRIQKSLKGLNIPKDISDNLVDSFSKLGPLLKDYKKQLNSGFSTQKDVNNLTNLGQKIDEVFGDIDGQIKKINSEDIKLNVDLTNIKNARSEVSKVTTELEKIINSTFDKIGDGLKKKNPNFSLDFLKGVYVSNDVKKVGKELSEAFNTRDIDRYRAAYEKLRQILNSTSNTSKTKQNIAQQMGLGPDAINDVDKVKSKVDELLKILRISDTTSSTFDKTKASLEQADSALTKLLQDAQSNGGRAFKGVQDGISGAQSSMQQLSTETRAYGQSIADANAQLKSLQQSTQYFFSLRNMINLLKRGVHEAIDVVKELDAAMTETAVVTDYSVGDMWQKLPEYTANANALGATVKDMYEATTLYYQQGLRTEAAMGIANETMKMARIGGLDAKDATDKMTAALRGFNMEVNEMSAQRVNDVYSNLAAKTASDTKELGTAMQRTASIAHSAGMSFEGTAAFLAQAIETTREPAENLGTAMKTIVARFTELKKNPLEITEVDGEEVSYNKVDTALQSIGVSLKDANGQFRDLDKVFLDISKRWDSLTQTQQRYVATTAAGSRQQSRFIAMMSNYERTMQLMDFANNSAGASNEQFGKTMESLEAKINKLKNAWDQFLMGIANNSMIKGAVDGITGLLTITNKLINTFSLGIGPVKSLLSLLMAFTGLKITGRFANSLVGGLGGILDPSVGFGKGFLSGAVGTRQQASAAQAQMIYQPIVNELRALPARMKGQNVPTENGSQNTIPFNQQAFKQAKNNIAELTKYGQKYSADAVVKQFKGLNVEQQRVLRNTMIGTSNKVDTTLLNRYRTQDKAQMKAIQMASSGFRNQAKVGVIAWSEYYNKVSDPVAMKKALDGNPKVSKATMEWVSGMADETTVQAKQNVRNAIEAGMLNNEKYANVNVNTPTWEKFVDKKATERWNEMSEAQQAAARRKAWRNMNPTEPLQDNTGTELLNGLGQIGAGISSAGMSLQSFGTLLTSSANPALQAFGGALTAIGGVLSSVGMGLSGLISGFNVLTNSEAMKGLAGGLSNLIGKQIPASAATGVLAGVAALTAIAVSAYKKHIQKLKDAGENVVKEYKEANEKYTSSINDLTTWQQELPRLQEGVDDYGNNVNLDTSDYERYREIINGIAELNPDIVEGYNAQGDAIIRNNSALDQTLAKQRELQKLATDDYLSQQSLATLIRARDTTDAFKKDKAAGGTESVVEAHNLISAMRQAGLGDSFFEALGFDYSKLQASHNNPEIQRFIMENEQIAREISEFYDQAGVDIDSHISEGLDNLTIAVDAEKEAIQDVYNNLMTYTSVNHLAPTNLPANLQGSFNKGIELIAKSRLGAVGMQKAVENLSKRYSVLTNENSQYNKIMEEVRNGQEEYSRTLDASGYKGEEYRNKLLALAKGEQELADKTDVLQDKIAHTNLAEFYTNEAEKAFSFTNKQVTDLTDAFAQFTDKINIAKNAYTDWQKQLENLNSPEQGVNSYKQILDDVFKETEDSNGTKHQYNTEAKGRPELWTGAAQILSDDWMRGKDTDAVANKLKSLQPLFREGQEGAIALGDKIRDALQAGEEFDGHKFSEFFEITDKGVSVKDGVNISDELTDSLAHYWDMQTPALVAALQNASQYGISLMKSTADQRMAISNDVRASTGVKSHATDELGRDITDLIVPRDVLVEGFHAAGEYNEAVIREGIVALRKQQGVFTAERVLATKNADKLQKEYGITQDNFLKVLGQHLGEDEVKDTYEGYYGKGSWTDKQQTQYDEIQEGIQSALEETTSEVPDIASSVANIEGMLAAKLYESGDATNFDKLDDFHKSIRGDEQLIDTSTDKLVAAGADKEHQYTKKDFDQYYKDNESALKASEALIKQLEAGLEKWRGQEDSEQYKSYSEQLKQAKEDYQYALAAKENADNYAKEQGWDGSTQPPSFSEAQIQSKINEVVSAGWGQLLDGIPPTALATPKAQDAMSVLAQNAFNLDMLSGPIAPEIQKAFSDLGINLEDALQSGLDAWPNPEEAQAAIDQKGQELGQIGEEAGSSMLNKVDTSWITNLASGIIQKYEESVNNNPINIPDVAPTVNKGAETVTGIAQQAVAATLTVDTSDSDAKLDATQQKTNEVANTINQGATFTIDVPGVDKLNQAATAASNLSKQGGNQTVGVKTSFDAGAVKSGVDAIKGMTAKVQVGANTKPALDTAESARRAIDNKSATINVSTSVKGQNVDIYVTKHVKEAYTGVNNKISYIHVPQAGSLARGTKKGKVGPRNQGGMTLTGEVGYEIAWLPSENRSVILGANGPQMVNLPKDATVYNHEQSKDIMKKRKGIPAGSTWSGSLPTSASVGGGGGNSNTAKIVNKTANHVKKKATEAASAVQKVSVWWENIARKTEVAQRQQDKNQKAFEKYIKEMRATLQFTGESLESGGGGGDDYLKSIGTTLGYYEAQLEKVTSELFELNEGTEAQIKASEKVQAAKDTKTKKDDKKAKKELEKANKKAYEDNASSAAKISYKKGKKSKEEIVNLAPYIKEEDGTFIIDQKKLDTIDNKDKRKAVADAANKEINDRLSKKYKAEDEIQKAQEAIEKFGEELYETFFKWENELTKIWNITQKIEQSEANISRTKSYQDLLDSQIATGSKKITDNGKDTGLRAEMLGVFNAGLTQLTQEIHSQVGLLGEQKDHLQNLLNITDERNTLDNVQKKLVDNVRNKNLNDTEVAGYEKYAAELEKTIDAQTQAWKYLSVNQFSDGTIQVDFDTKTFETDKENGEITGDLGKAIQDYVKELTEANKELNSQYETIISKTVEVNDQLKTLQEQWVGYAEELWQISDEEQKKEVDNLKKVSDSVTNTLKNLLDEVKRKLDQRRKAEDNAKTEQDISKKQQRLAALQADTSGGHQVEIAQLQQEIADAQQNYQRSLEDQLLDNLQQQADVASQQREQQIALQEATITAINNAAQVDEWMSIVSNPETTPEELEQTKMAMFEAYKAANDFDEKPKALQDELIKKFESMFAGLVTNQDEQKAAQEALKDLNTKQERVVSVLETIKQSIDAITIPSSIEVQSTGANADIKPGNTQAKIEQEQKIVQEEENKKKAEEDKKKAEEEQQQAIAAAQKKYNEFLYNRGDASSKDKNKGKIDKKALNEQISRGQELGYSENKVLQDLADTSKLSWTDVLKAYISAKGKKNAAKAIKTYFGNNPSDAKKKGWKKAFGKKYPKYDTGGIANYTGPAWLDGTPSKPELVLNATDTQNFLALRDVLSKALNSTNSVTNSYGGNASYEININVDKLSNDYDVDKVAERVKKIIVKDSGYRNVTQVRNFR